MASKQELEYQYEKLLSRQALANSLLGIRTKHLKGGCSREELEDQAQAAAVKPQVAGKRVASAGGCGVV